MLSRNAKIRFNKSGGYFLSEKKAPVGMATPKPYAVGKTKVPAGMATPRADFFEEKKSP